MRGEGWGDGKTGRTIGSWDVKDDKWVKFIEEYIVTRKKFRRL